MKNRYLWVGTLFLVAYAASTNYAELASPLVSISIELSFVAAAFLIIRWADAYEPEDELNLFWALLWGAGATVILAQFLYQATDTFNQSISFSAAIEEISKISVLLPAVKFRLVNSWTDGFVYGALAGLGFSFTEDLLYANLSDDGIATIINRCLYSIFAHSVFSGLAGACVMYLWYKQKYAAFIIGIIPGIALHSAWNSWIRITTDLSFQMLAFIAPSVFVALAILLRDIEKSEISKASERLLKTGEIDLDTWKCLTDLRHRRIVRRSLVGDIEKARFDGQMQNLVRKLLA